jgi:cobalt-zinc-cadmium resistance protein CzcA
MTTERPHGIAAVIRASFARPLLALVLLLAGAALGVISFQELRRDVFPDLSAPVFNVIVQNPAMGAENWKRPSRSRWRRALARLPSARRIRSSSQLGVCQVTIEFEADADYYARGNW